MMDIQEFHRERLHRELSLKKQQHVQMQRLQRVIYRGVTDVNIKRVRQRMAREEKRRRVMEDPQVRLRNSNPILSTWGTT